MSLPEFGIHINSIILDIEGTVCPISFVKDELFPYFLKQVPSVLSKVQFPLDLNSNDRVTQILVGFPEEYHSSQEKLLEHIRKLVSNDVKEATLKSLQGLIWQKGYESGEIVAPLFDDAVEYIKNWQKNKKIYIYSSGSINAQKLLFGHVSSPGSKNNQENLNNLLSGYFDITTSGFKTERSSYEKILQDIGVVGKHVLFLSDNVKEVKAAIDAGINSCVVVKPGNAPLSEEDRQAYIAIDDFSQLKV